MTKQKNIIQQAIKRPWALRKKAQQAWMTVDEYCRQEHKDERTNYQCRFYNNMLKKAIQKKKQKAKWQRQKASRMR